MDFDDFDKFDFIMNDADDRPPKPAPQRNSPQPGCLATGCIMIIISTIAYCIC